MLVVRKRLDRIWPKTFSEIVKISVPYSNDEISKSVMKNNESIPTYSIISSTKARRNMFYLFVPTVKSTARKIINYN